MRGSRLVGAASIRKFTVLEFAELRDEAHPAENSAAIISGKTAHRRRRDVFSESAEARFRLCKARLASPLRSVWQNVSRQPLAFIL